jgi:hypothetical protein
LFKKLKLREYGLRSGKKLKLHSFMRRREYQLRSEKKTKNSSRNDSFGQKILTKSKARNNDAWALNPELKGKKGPFVYRTSWLFVVGRRK